MEVIIYKAELLDTIPPLGAGLQESLEQELKVLSYEAPVIRSALKGGQSTCYIIDAGRERLVLKVFDSESNSPARVAEEYHALEKIYETSTRYPAVSIPKPLALFDQHVTFLMTFVQGDDIDDLMGRGFYPSSRLDDLAATMISGFRVYHEALGRQLGDCHPGNFFVRSPRAISIIDSLVIIHPTVEPELFVAEDIGYWAAAVVVNVPIEFQIARRLPINRIRLTWRLIDHGCKDMNPAEQIAFQRAVFAAANRYVDLWTEAQTLKGRIKTPPTRALLRFMAARGVRPVRRATDVKQLSSKL